MGMWRTKTGVGDVARSLRWKGGSPAQEQANLGAVSPAYDSRPSRIPDWGLNGNGLFFWVLPPVPQLQDRWGRGVVVSDTHTHTAF